MPIVNRGPQSVTTLATGALPSPAPEPEWSIGSIFGAAFRQNNVVGSGLSFASNMWGSFNDMDESYNPWDDIKGTRYEDKWQVFAQSNNRHYTEALKRQVDMEARDRGVLDSAGWTGVLANFGANVLDPTVLIPVGGEIIKGAQGAYRIADVALRSSIAAGISTTAQEAGLQGTQETRPLQDSAMNIGSNIILGGILGGGIAALLSKGERQTVMRGYDALLPTDGGGGLSAAPVKLFTEGELTPDGVVSGAAAKATQFLSPNLRLNQSPSAYVRQVAQQLAENTLYQAGHADGVTVGPAVERLAKMAADSRMAGGVQQMRAIYAEMKAAGIRMKFDDFSDAIGRAMRAEDRGENPFIEKAAKAWRASVIEPFFQEGKAAGLYAEGDDVSFAPSYFPRQYNKKVLVAREPEIKAEWGQFMEGRIKADYDAARMKLQDEIAGLDQQVVDLQLTPEARAKALDSLDQQSTQLDADYAEEALKVAQIAELRRTAVAAKKAGDLAGEKLAKEQAASIQAEGGQRLAEYQKLKGSVSGRRKRVDFGYAGLESRNQALLNRLNDLDLANQRALRRLVDRGRKLEQRVADLTPDRFDKEISAMRTQFADVLAKQERAAERLGRLKETAPDEAMTKAVIAQEAKLGPAREEKLRAIDEQLQQVEELGRLWRERASGDPAELKGMIADLNAKIENEVIGASNASQRRGATAARLEERLKTMDPARIGDQVKRLAERRAAKIREFLDTWEIKKLGENIDPFDPGAMPRFKELAKDVIDDIYDKLTGRDYGASASVAPEYMTPIERGPVKERTLPIPDAMLEKQGVLDNDVIDVMHRYARTLAADVELTRKFGDARLDGPLQKIAEEYRQLRKGVTDPGELAKLDKRQRADQRDLEALRDLVRGTYKAAENGSNFARVVRVANHYNFIRHMGGVVVSSLNDIYRPAMVLGLKSFMADGVGPLLKGSVGVKMSVKEAQLAGTVLERVLAHRLTSITGIADPMERGTPIERMMANMSHVGSTWSGITLWNDTMQSLTSIITQNNLLGGQFNTRELAFLGIDPDMAGRIAKQYEVHGDMMDGVHVANTEAWTDADAIRSYRAAVAKEVDRVIVAPGAGDVPLFARTPIGKLLFQFRSFSAAAWSKVFLSGMAESKARFLSGTIAMASLGIMSAYLSAWRGGSKSFEKFQEKAKNPGFLIGEGLDRAGVFTLGFDFANTGEKVVQSTTGFSFNPLKFPLQLGGRAFVPSAPVEGESQRYSTRGPVGAIGGPTAGLIFEDVPAAAMGGVAALRGRPVTSGQRRAAQSLLPYQSFLGFREAVQAMNGDSPYADQMGTDWAF